MKKINLILTSAIAFFLVVAAVLLFVLCMRGCDKDNKSVSETYTPNASESVTTNATDGNISQTDGNSISTQTPTANVQTQAPNNQSPNTTSQPQNQNPSKPLSGMTICIDAGHQGQGNTEKEACAPWGSDKNSKVNNSTMKAKCTSGTTGKYTGIPEYQTTLQIAKKVEATLEGLGATVVMVRDTHDVNISNIERAQIGNNAKADVTLRIHCNGAENTSANGIDVYTRGVGDGTSEYSTRSNNDYALASELLDYLVAATGAKKRNVNKSDSYTGINWSEVPCIIIECGFMSNEIEDKNLNDAVYQQKIADGIASWLKATSLL